MTLAQRAWLVFVTGLPFAWFLVPWLDVWKAQTYVAHLGLVVLGGLLIAQGGRSLPRNLPLACWIGYCVALSLVLFNLGIKQWGSYTMEMALPLLHVLAVLVFYLCAMSQWDVAFVQRLFWWVGVSGAVVLAYCVLQLLHLDQFYLTRDRGVHSFIGVVGNVSVCAAHLSLLFPIFVYLAQNTHRAWWCAVGTSLFLIAWLAVINHSAGGVLGIISVLAVWGVLQDRLALVLAGLLIVLGMALTLAHPALVDFSGRWDAWREYLTYIRKASITGHGLGAVLTLSTRELPQTIRYWQHVHNEFLQVWLEQGVIGLALMGWVIVDWCQAVWRLRGDRLVTCCASLGAAFLVNSLIGFPMHLWVLGSLGLLSYCGIVVLRGDRSCATLS